MQVTVRELLYDIRSLIDEYNIDGNVISETEVSTIETNSIRFINQALREAYKLTRVFKTDEIINKPVPNLIGNQYNVVQFIGTDQQYPVNGVKGAKAYYFVADGNFTAFIEEYDGSTWNTLETISDSITKPTVYKGLITASDSEYPIRLVMSGSNYYEHKNRALYRYPFTLETIPSYEKYIVIELPEDYGELQEVNTDDNVSLYNDPIYRQEGFDEFYLLRDFEGKITIRYIPMPTTVTSTSDTVTINNPLIQEFVIAHAAAKVATTENPELVNYYEEKSKELEFKASKGQPVIETETVDVYGVTGGFNGYV